MDDLSKINALYNEGKKEFLDGKYYDAHEVWEDLWSDYYLKDRKFIQGLIQLSVSFVHLKNGNMIGAKNLLKSLKNIVDTYELDNNDIAMVVMPLFHVHGLIGVALATLSSGGEIIIPEKFSAGAFWKLQKKHNATWYSAVPTIHQILLIRSEEDNAPKKSFRFIRSCSAALAPSVLKDLEN